MTEAEWTACTDPRQMLEFLRGKASDRKLRLLALACLPKIARFDDRIAQMLVTIERYAEGQADWNELSAARKMARLIGREAMQRRDVPFGAGVLVLIEAAAHPSAWTAMRAVTDTYDSLAWLHEIIGNPFRPSAPLTPAVLSWNDGTVRRIAEGIYEERQLPAGTIHNARLVILADALVDAGCNDDDIIQHCRSEGPHVRGCWALDRVLGREGSPQRQPRK